MLRRLALATALAVSAHTAVAQSCGGAADIFLKNDNLPQNPGTQTVSIIRGLCEDEAMGCVFDVSGQQFSNDVKVNSIAGGFINAASANGVTAVVDVEIYDGITFNGAGIPTLGPRVFEFESAAGANVQFASSGLNVVDLTNFNVHVTSGKLVVVVEMLLTTSAGSCAAGYSTNFATDWSGAGSGCSPLQKNLLYIQGQGWRDAALANVSGIPLCPIYYAGNWLIRACVEPVGYPRSYCTGKVNSQNCTPAVGWTGTATLASGPDNFHIRCTNVINQLSGIFFWGQGPLSAPFFGGTLCVTQPITRSPILNSGGSIGPQNCTTGAYDFLFSHAYAASNSIVAGQSYYGQFWMRDPPHFDGTTVGFSNALEFRFLP